MARKTKPGSMVQISASIPVDLHDRLKAEAERSDSSESRVIRAALRAYLDSKPGPVYDQERAS